MIMMLGMIHVGEIILFPRHAGVIGVLEAKRGKRTWEFRSTFPCCGEHERLLTNLGLSFEKRHCVVAFIRL